MSTTKEELKKQTQAIFFKVADDRDTSKAITDYTFKIIGNGEAPSWSQTAKNPLSSAWGPGQFIESTWQGTCRAGHFDPNDRSMNNYFGVLFYFTEQNMNALRRELGREPTGSETYLAHIKPPQAAKIIKAYAINPATPADKFFTHDEIRKNPAIFHGKSHVTDYTVQDVMAYTHDRMDEPLRQCAEFEKRKQAGQTITPQEEQQNQARHSQIMQDMTGMPKETADKASKNGWFGELILKLLEMLGLLKKTEKVVAVAVPPAQPGVVAVVNNPGPLDQNSIVRPDVPMNKPRGALTPAS